ncbi:MAG: glycosyltransferase [Deltaproteobacteria bacterium]|nr:MAG: glycosyltransferase [Deltaproteobacteria bacterium]
MHPPLRALFFVDVPHRFAGAQRSLLAALSRIEEHGVDPLVVFPGPGKCVDRYRATGVRTRIVHAPPALMTFGKVHLRAGWWHRGRTLARAVVPYSVKLARLVVREHIDVIHYNTPRGILAAGLAAKLSRRPAVLHLRGTVPFRGALWAAAQALADRIVLVAHALEGELGAAARARATVVYNGVDIPDLPPADRARAELATTHGISALTDPAVSVCVSLSSPVPFKGLHDLFEAVARLRDAGRRLLLLCAGEGQDRRYLDWLDALRRRLGLTEVVHMLGYVADPLALLAAADLCVLSSVDRVTINLPDGHVIEGASNEGLPRTILEAMACGVPVVATDIAGVREQVEDGVTGHIVPQADPAAFAAALERALADTDWRRAAGTRAREIARTRFSVPQAAAGLATALRRGE